MHNYESVKEAFLSGRIKGCKTYFEQNRYFVEAAYCYIILDDLTSAQFLFEKVKNVDNRARWGLFLLYMLRGDVLSFPTYFQIRNFLEIDLSILMLYCKGDYVERIISYSNLLFQYNPEAYKFIGRAFWANGFIPASLFFLRKAKDNFYQDPELHYQLAYIYYKEEQNIGECKKALNTCLNMLPDYYPAKRLLETINY